VQPNRGTPTPTQTNQAYGQYHLHHYDGNVQNVNQVDKTTAQDDQHKYGPFGWLIHMVNGQHEVDSHLSQTAKNLKQGLDMRSAPSAPNANYLAQPHQTLYDSVTQHVNPASVADVSATWTDIGDSLTKLQNTVAQSIASSQVTWTGTSGEAARQNVAEMGNKSGQAGQAAQLAGVLVGQQYEALSTAKNSIPPPPKTPFNQATALQQLQTVTDPVAHAKQAAADVAQQQAQQQAHQQAARVVQQYDQTVSQTSASMPAFAPAPPPPKPVGPQPTKHPAVPPIDTPPVGGNPPPVGSTQHGSPVGVPPRSPNTPPPPVRFQPVPSPPLPPPEPNVPPVIGNRPPVTTVQNFNPPVTGTPNPNNPNQFGPPGLNTGIGSGQDGSGGGGFGGFGAGGFGGGSGGSGFGSGGSGGSGFGSGSGGSGGGASGSGAQSGAGAAAAEKAAMGGSAAGARGGAGAAGSPMMGGGRGQRGQDDQEHKRPSWLVESDDGIFGTDERTVPPVIGE
jgi:hypothetical protein